MRTIIDAWGENSQEKAIPSILIDVNAAMGRVDPKRKHKPVV
jgi:hypothetical protein